MYVFTLMMKMITMVSNIGKQRFGRTTKFKHFKGTTRAKSEMFENLKNLSKSMASECDLIKANIDRVAIPLAGMFSWLSRFSFDPSFSGPGGKLVVFETAKAGRLTDGVYPSFINGVLILIPSNGSFLPSPPSFFRGPFSTLTLTRSTATDWFVQTRMGRWRCGSCRKEVSSSRFPQDPLCIHSKSEKVGGFCF